MSRLLASRARAAHTRRSWLFGFVAIALVLSTAPAVTTRLYASDEVQYYVYLRSLWFDRDLSFDNEYRRMYESGVARTDGFRETLLERTTATGRRLNFGTIGCAVLWAPFYALADLGVIVTRQLGSHVERDGYSHPYIAAVCYASATYGWLALLASSLAASRVVRIRVGHRRVVGAALLVCFATPLAFYMYVAPGFAHATSAFAVSIFTLAWLRLRQRWTIAGCAIVGALGALVVLVREQDAFLLIAPAIDLAWVWGRGLRADDRASSRGAASGLPRVRLILGACIGAIAFAATFLPQVLAYVALNGRIGPSPLLTRKMTWSSPHAIAVLLSPEHGLVWWTPAVIVAIAGLVLLIVHPRPQGDHRDTLDARHDVSGTRGAAGCLLGMFAGHVYVTGCVSSWTLAGAFGQRRFVALTPVLVIGVVALVSRLRTRTAKLAIGTACVLCVWWNVGLMVQFGAGMMDRQRLELLRNGRTTFLVLPGAMPRLVYRYVFDRSSFYHRPESGG